MRNDSSRWRRVNGLSSEMPAPTGPGGSSHGKVVCKRRVCLLGVAMIQALGHVFREWQTAQDSIWQDLAP